MSTLKLTTAGLLLASCLQPAQAVEIESTGKLSLSARYFPSTAAQPEQLEGVQTLLSFSPEFRWQSEEGDDLVSFLPYLRVDSRDSERTDGDIRELYWIHVGDQWESRIGLRKVFWGVTEFQHLVDVINQSDLAEDLDGEDKLGQPMINLSRVTEYGIVDLYLLTGFRERTYPGVAGRLRAPLPIRTDDPLYQSSAGQKHLDLALRWSESYDDWDLGVHYFKGTNRDPQLQLAVDTTGQAYLRPYYEQMEQIGLDAQLTAGDTLWKLETLYRDSDSDHYWAVQGGFEHTLYGIADSYADLGLLMEYGWDQRDNSSVLAQNELFIGARLALNDEDSSALLVGISEDLDHNSRSLLLEASRRLAPGWVVSLDLRLFNSPVTSDPLYSLRHDDHLQLTLERYF